MIEFIKIYCLWIFLETTVSSKGPVAGAFGKGSMAVASDDSGTVVATGNW